MKKIDVGQPVVLSVLQRVDTDDEIGMAEGTLLLLAETTSTLASSLSTD